MRPIKSEKKEQGWARREKEVDTNHFIHFPGKLKSSVGCENAVYTSSYGTSLLGCECHVLCGLFLSCSHV